MHELSLAQALLEPVLQLAQDRGATVSAVTVRAGQLAGVVADSLALAWQGVTEGTAAAGSLLRLEVVPVVARCRRCGLRFEVDDVVYLCPRCDVADVDTISGTELTLVRVELVDAN